MSLNHKIIEWFGLRGTLKSCVAQVSFSEQRHPQLGQAAQSSIQSDLKPFQGWGIYHLSRPLVLLFHHSYCKKSLLSTLNRYSLRSGGNGFKQLQDTLPEKIVPVSLKGAVRSPGALVSPGGTAPAPLATCLHGW